MQNRNLTARNEKNSACDFFSHSWNFDAISCKKMREYREIAPENDPWYLRTQNVPQIRCINCNIRASCLSQFSLISILLNIKKASKHCDCRWTITNAYGQCIEKDEFSKLPLSDPPKLGLFPCSLEILTNASLFLEIYLGVPLVHRKPR